MIRPLSAPGLPTLAEAGGKGASLARLAAADLPVPDGFIISTAAYEQFVAAADLRSVIAAALDGLAADEPAALTATSESIRAAFEAAAVPSSIVTAVERAYEALAVPTVAVPTVAVRSSATAEDLPELSFAGQQETFLSVRGAEAVVDAVRSCWASLWTARAIGYRARMGIGQDEIAMAVVVQAMVPAEVSGVLFTANPSTGARDEILINASYGLGEAIVSGEVTPDGYLLEREGFAIREAVLGTKEVAIVPVALDGQDAQGVERRAVGPAERAAHALPEPQLRALAALGVEVEQLFDGQPQDIEWALAAGRLWLLQARPITKLPPAPLVDVTWEHPQPDSAWIRRQVVEHMPDPLSPLFEELYLHDGMERSIEVFMREFDMDMAMIDRMMDRPYFATVNGFAYMRANYRLSLSVFASVMRIYVKTLPKMMRTFLPYWRDVRLKSYHETIDRWRMTDTELEAAEDARLLDGIRELAAEDAIYWFAASMPIAVAKVTDGLLGRFVKQLERKRKRAMKRGGSDSGVEGEPWSSAGFLRGFPSDALDAEVALEAMAKQVREDEALRERVLARPAGELMDVLASAPSGGAVREALAAYLEQYGHQIYSLDFATPTQAEAPLPVLLGLKALVAHPERDARALQATFVAERERLATKALRTFGLIRRPIFRKALSWAQRYAPLREEALFHVGAGWPTLRRLALELGGRLADAGSLDAADDVFFLRSDELLAASEARAAGTARADLGDLASERRSLREAQMRLHPPQTVPVDYRFKFGPFDMGAFETQKRNPQEGEPLQGFAVSPGRVTAPASVILSPADFEHMKPDTILVCPTTTPAWTPLFAQAAGLVTDIGGVLAHGSIVAREYGIPAVMGTGVATERIRDGQMVRVDGDAGTVEVVGA
jgi:pyruvate,water dikinase